MRVPEPRPGHPHTVSPRRGSHFGERQTFVGNPTDGPHVRGSDREAPQCRQSPPQLE